MSSKAKKSSSKSHKSTKSTKSTESSNSKHVSSSKMEHAAKDVLGVIAKYGSTPHYTRRMISKKLKDKNYESSLLFATVSSLVNKGTLLEKKPGERAAHFYYLPKKRAA